MKEKPDLVSRAGIVAAAALLAAGCPFAGSARADDLTTLSGQTFRDVQPLRVEPDGITWRHAGGVAKVDFADSPEAVRAAYHYDPARAAAYREEREKVKSQADEQARQLLQARDERLRARARAEVHAPDPAAPAGPPPPPANTVVYRHGLAPTVEAAARSLDEQADARKVRQAAEARNAEGLGNPRFWSLVPGVGSAPVPPRMDIPNKDEFKASLRHAPGDFAASANQDNFFQPIYMTKSYNEDVDRAAAFARGVPLK